MIGKMISLAVTDRTVVVGRRRGSKRLKAVDNDNTGGGYTNLRNDWKKRATPHSSGVWNSPIKNK